MVGRRLLWRVTLFDELGLRPLRLRAAAAALLLRQQLLRAGALGLRRRLRIRRRFLCATGLRLWRLRRLRRLWRLRRRAADPSGAAGPALFAAADRLPLSGDELPGAERLSVRTGLRLRLFRIPAVRPSRLRLPLWVPEPPRRPLRLWPAPLRAALRRSAILPRLSA